MAAIRKGMWKSWASSDSNIIGNKWQEKIQFPDMVQCEYLYIITGVSEDSNVSVIRITNYQSK